MSRNRKATFFVCDDTLISLNGKLFANGIYTGDIGIPTQDLPLAQLVCLFLIELDVDDPCQQITVRVELPGSPASPQMTFALQHPPFVEGRHIFVHKIPLLVQQPILMPGAISAFVNFDDQEMMAGQQWIVLSSPQPVDATNTPKKHKT